jgi:hypothetical protein
MPIPGISNQKSVVRLLTTTPIFAPDKALIFPGSILVANNLLIADY